MDCFADDHGYTCCVEQVSISALSDRGLLLVFRGVGFDDGDVSISALSDRGLLL